MQKILGVILFVTGIYILMIFLLPNTIDIWAKKIWFIQVNEMIRSGKNMLENFSLDEQNVEKVHEKYSDVKEKVENIKNSIQ